MNARIIIVALSLAPCFAARAEDPATNFDASTPARTSAEWKYNPALWRELFQEKAGQPGVVLGKTDLVVRGPLISTFRRPAAGKSDRSLGQKILGLPIVNLFVPRPMPASPSTGGKYFAWGDSASPWAARAWNAAPATVGFNNAINHEPNAVLISVER